MQLYTYYVEFCVLATTEFYVKYVCFMFWDCPDVRVDLESKPGQVK